MLTLPAEAKMNDFQTVQAFTEIHEWNLGLPRSTTGRQSCLGLRTANPDFERARGPVAITDVRAFGTSHEPAASRRASAKLPQARMRIPHPVF